MKIILMRSINQLKIASVTITSSELLLYTNVQPVWFDEKYK